MNDHKHNPTPLRPATFFAVVLSLSALLFGGAAAEAADFGTLRGASYTVTITNLTYDQTISPPVVVTHDERFSLFEPGRPAGDELAALAEDGMTGPLVGLLMVSTGVSDFTVAAGGIPPQGSISVRVGVGGRARLLSLAGMLISTNDAFAGIDGHAIALGLLNSAGSMIIDVPAWDAGSEANTESCDHIPGPPCGSPGVRVTEGAEGFVHVHRGIRGTGDLDASAKDWRNPVARISITRR